MAAIRKQIKSGHVLNLLKYEARSVLETWIMNREYEDETFCIVFRMSLNRTHDDGLFLDCVADWSGEEPLVKVLDVQFGFVDMPPDDCEDVDTFEVMFCDLETNPFGAYDV